MLDWSGLYVTRPAFATLPSHSSGTVPLPSCHRITIAFNAGLCQTTSSSRIFASSIQAICGQVLPRTLQTSPSSASSAAKSQTSPGTALGLFYIACCLRKKAKSSKKSVAPRGNAWKTARKKPTRTSSKRTSKVANMRLSKVASKRSRTRARSIATTDLVHTRQSLRMSLKKKSRTDLVKSLKTSLSGSSAM